ncbi:MAG: hypothetical protein EBT86_00465 [Actinobacteria bacterium]|nr:hypothetical protein [Actinomycetota bacterium]
MTFQEHSIGSRLIAISMWIGLISILGIFIWEFLIPTSIKEGFEDSLGVSIGNSAYWTRWFPRRGDVGPNVDAEDRGYLRDIRYFNGFTDVQRLGVNHDFCRMVQKRGDPKETFFACALAGTEGLSTVSYRTKSIRDGFKISRDDYMRDILNEGRDAYCRILKQPSGAFMAKCNPAGDESFLNRLVTDTNPPEEIATLLDFYQGIMVWLRLRDDMVDYAKNVRVSKAGEIYIDEEPPNPPETDGLVFNGIDQFIRISDSDDLSIGDVIQMRFMRAFSFWVYFDEFTNNTHIFDFGNGAGKDNIWIGIQGRGDPAVSTGSKLRPLLCENPESQVLPDNPSGPQPSPEVSPEELMETTQANVDEYVCPKPEVYGKRMPPLEPTAEPQGEAKMATLIYEVWDSKQRKMHIQIPNFFPLHKWTHVCVTAKNEDAFRPDIQIYKDGILVYEEQAGHLPQTSSLSSNYIGKSNWTDVTSQMENSDQLFKGKLFDFRMYKTPMSEKKIQKTVQWGAKKLRDAHVPSSSEIRRTQGRPAPCRPTRVQRAEIINRPPAVV